MTPYIYEWVQKQIPLYRPQPPVLEVGSYNVNGSVRDLFPEPYIGLDMRPGPGVDLVHNVERAPLQGMYNTIVCCEILEHTPAPHIVMHRMASVLHRGGTMFVTVPFMMAVHSYPDDYWRMTTSAVRHLMLEADITPVLLEYIHEGTHTCGIGIKQ